MDGVSTLAFVLDGAIVCGGRTTFLAVPGKFSVPGSAAPAEPRELHPMGPQLEYVVHR